MEPYNGPIHIEVDHSVRNTIIRRLTLFLFLSIFLTPSALYYYYHSSSARSLTTDKEFMSDIHTLEARRQMVNILTPTPPQPQPFPEVKGNIFSQLLSNFLSFIHTYLPR